MKHAMTYLLMVLTMLTSVSVARAEEPPNLESLLTEAETREIHERTKAETLERELRREREVQMKHNMDLQRQVIETRARIEDQRARQQRYEAQLMALKQEGMELQARHASMSRELASEEMQRKNQEVETLRVKTQMEVMNLKLKDSLESLEKRRAETLTKIEASKALVARWNEEIASAQADIVKNEMARYEFQKSAQHLDAQTVDLQKKLEDTNREREKAQSDTAEMKAKLEETRKNYEKTLAATKEQEQLRQQQVAQFNAANAEYLAEKKKLRAQTAQAEAQRVLAEQEKLKYAAEAKKLSASLDSARYESEQAHLKLAESQNTATQSKLSLAKVRNDLLKELTPEVEAWSGNAKPASEASTKPAPAPVPAAVPAPDASDDEPAPQAAAPITKTPAAAKPAAPAKRETAAVAGTFGKAWTARKTCTIYE